MLNKVTVWVTEYHISLKKETHPYHLYDVPNVSLVVNAHLVF